MQICKNIYGKGRFLQKCGQYEQVGKASMDLNQQDFLEGDRAKERHKKEIHLEGVRQMFLFF